MKIINRDAFFAMPNGTVYSEYQPCFLRGMYIKYDNITSKGGELIDFYFVEAINEVDCSGSSECADILTNAEKNGSSFDLHFNTITRDGMFDHEALFAVWERADVEGLIARLGTALNDAYPEAAEGDQP